MSFDKTRRNNLWGAGMCAALGLFELFIARRAQIDRTVILHRGSWYTQGFGYFFAACLFALAAFALFRAFRKSDDQKQ